MKDIFGEDIQKRWLSVVFDPNRLNILHVMLDYLIVEPVHLHEQLSNKDFCIRLLNNFEETKKTIESDICKLKDRISKQETENE